MPQIIWLGNSLRGIPLEAQIRDTYEVPFRQEEELKKEIEEDGK